MWNDGLVVTMKWFDEKLDGIRFLLLLPDGSEQLMDYAEKRGFDQQEREEWLIY